MLFFLTNKIYLIKLFKIFTKKNKKKKNATFKKVNSLYSLF